MIEESARAVREMPKHTIVTGHKEKHEYKECAHRAPPIKIIFSSVN